MYGGADVVCYGGIMREYARQRALGRLTIPVPVLTPWLSSLGLITPLHARVGRKLIDSIASADRGAGSRRGARLRHPSPRSRRSDRERAPQ